MSEHFVGNASASSSTSSWNSSSHDTEDDHAIAKILDEEENSKNGNRLGRRLSHLDSIPVSLYHILLVFFSLVGKFKLVNRIYTFNSMVLTFLNCYLCCLVFDA